MGRDRDIERELGELGSGIEYPPTPDLARTVRRRLEGEDEQRTSRWTWLPVLSPRWTAAAAMLMLVLAIPVLSPAARDTLSNLLVVGQAGGGGAQSASEAGGSAGGGAAERDHSAAPAMREETESPQASSPGATRDQPSSGGSSDTGENLPSSGGPPPLARALGEGLEPGGRITPGEARARVDEVSVPGIGEPDEFYAAGPEGAVLVYRARPGMLPLGDTGIGLILTDLPGDVGSAYLPDGARPDAEIEEVSVGGERGYWAPRGSAASYRSGGVPVNVLLWDREGRALRLESNLPLERAVRIAASVR